jgi:hypothetical protein
MGNLNLRQSSYWRLAERRLKGGDARQVEKRFEAVFKGCQPFRNEFRKEINMNKNLWLKLFMAVLILTLCSSTVLAQDQPKGPPPFPPPPAQCLAYEGYLYVLVGPSVLQYQVTDMSLKTTVTLPAPEDSWQVSSSSQKPPRPPMLSMVIDDGHLYLVTPGYVFQYSLPGLALENQKALPKPEALK